MDNRIIETIGYISKVETVHTVEHNVMPNTLVLENIEPFPGYHGSVPSDQPPLSIFLVTQKKYTFEEISRVSAKIKGAVSEKISCVFGDLKVFNDNYPSIRILGLESFENIEAIQKALAREGIEFSKKNIVNDCAIIKIQKTFLLQDKGDGIYYDMDEPEMMYFEISKKIDWDKFQETTKHVKNNVKYTNFDAALGYIYRHNGIIDVVRIYTNNISLGQLKELKELYNKEINKL